MIGSSYETIAQLFHCQHAVDQYCSPQRNGCFADESYSPSHTSMQFIKWIKVIKEQYVLLFICIYTVRVHVDLHTEEIILYMF